MKSESKGQPLTARATEPNETGDDLLALLALSGGNNITGLTKLAGAAGIRQTPTRQHSTTTLRPYIEAQVHRGLARETAEGFAVPFGARPVILRCAAARGRLLQLARAVEDAGRAHYYYRNSYAEFMSALTALDVALASCSPTVARDLEGALAAGVAAGALSEREVGARSVYHALETAFDPSWFERLPEAVQAQLFGLAARAAEGLGWPLQRMHPYALERSRLFLSDPAAHAAFFGVAVLSGALDDARSLAELATGDLRGVLASALAVARGEFSERQPVPRPKQQTTIGVAWVLQALLLLKQGSSEELEAVDRIVRVGNRKTAPFRGSVKALKTLLEETRDPQEDPIIRAPGIDEAGDCLETLVHALYIIWNDVKELADLHAEGCQRFAERFEKQELPWLSAQYRACAGQLTAMGPKQRRRAAARQDTAQQDTAQQGAAQQGAAPVSGVTYTLPGRAVFELHTSKEPWERSMEALERIAATVSTKNVEPGGGPAERVVWRVSPHSLAIEPFLQKRKGAGYTRGRRLGLKQLLPGAEQSGRLPPEDRAVAAHLREAHERNFGYPRTYQYFDRRAWLALVGHPRVELASTESPIEVVRGVAQIVTRTSRNGLALRLEPAGLAQELEVWEESGKLVVYAVDERALPLLKWLGGELELPAAARERTLEVLNRLSHLLPVQTSERTTAKQVAADPRLWLRILPRGSGLSVSAFVRPLGASGPELTAGLGAARLLGHQDGEAVETERDLRGEQKHLDDWIAHCPVFAGTGLESDPVLFEDASQCLEVLSALQRPECRVMVEWPEGTPLKLRAQLGRKSLRATIQRGAAHFFAAGSLVIDESLSLDLGELLSLVAESPGKFVRLSNGDFIELERELRETLGVLESGRHESSEQGRVVLSTGALESLRQSSGAEDVFELDGAASDYFVRLEKAFSSTPRLPRGLQAELREYQVDGFRWLARLADAELAGCLADDMGLGKTLQAIALLLHRAKHGPALVVAPTSVCDNWRRELARFAPSLEVRYFAGQDRARVLENLGPRQVVIASYALLQQDVELLQPLPFATAILDEAQMIKNAESLRARAACSLNAKARFALTGTPVENHVGDLYSIFRFLLPDLFGGWGSFNRRFGAARSGEAGGQARRSLKRLLRPYLLRRTKAQVLEELPPLTEIEHRVALGPAELLLYEGIRRKALEALEEGLDGKRRDPSARLRVLAEITRLRRLCCHPQLVAPGAPDTSAKLDALLELLSELRDGGHRALVFSQFVDVLRHVRARLDACSISYQYLDGSTPPARRSAAVDAFQSGEGDVFLISLKAGGFGLNLTAADYVIHVDPWWNPAVEAQASDRAHRIGQSRPVTVYRLIAEGTIEERIVELHRHKRDLANSLLDESHQTAQLGPDELRALLRTDEAAL